MIKHRSLFRDKRVQPYHASIDFYFTWLPLNNTLHPLHFLFYWYSSSNLVIKDKPRTRLFYKHELYRLTASQPFHSDKKNDLQTTFLYTTLGK